MLDIEGIVLYDVKDLAEKLNITTQTVKIYIRTKKIQAQRIGGKYYVSSDNLKTFLTAGTGRKEG